MPALSAWLNDTRFEKLQDLLNSNINGYSDEFLQNEKRERFKPVFQSTKMSNLVSELLNIGLLVVEGSLKSDDKYKIDMSEYYELLLYKVLIIESGFVNGNPNHEEVQARVNRLFRGSSDSDDFE